MERLVQLGESPGFTSLEIDEILKDVDLEKNHDLLEFINKLNSYVKSLENDNRQLKKSLHEQENEYTTNTTIYQSTSIGYFTLDKKGKIKDANPQGTNILDDDLNEIIGTNFKDFIGQNSIEIFDKTLLNASKMNKSQLCEVTIIKDEDVFYGELKVEPLFDSEDNLKEFLITLIDVSEHKKNEMNHISKFDYLLKINELEEKIEKNKLSDKKLRASEKREQARSEEFAKVLDAVPAAVWISHDNKGLLITGNQLSYDYLNITQGANASKSLPPEDRPETFRILKDGFELDAEEMPIQMSSAGSEIRNYEFDIVYNNSKTRHMMGNATPLYDETGNPRGSVSVFIDITEYKKAKTKLEILLKELERSNKDLENYAYVTSHDLKEPLRSIASFTQLLEKRYKGQLDKDADEFIGFIVDGARRMQDMLDSLLAYSRITTKAKICELIEMDDVVDASLKNLKIAIDENDAHISLKPLPKIFADRSLMIQLFQNLIANAIKFHGDEKPKINISSKEIGNKYYFEVEDNGIGIDPQYQERIFKVFQRLHTLDEYDGTGIGLSITKKIVQHHNGSIWVKSKPGQGSTFCFSIPIPKKVPKPNQKKIN